MSSNEILRHQTSASALYNASQAYVSNVAYIPLMMSSSLLGMSIMVASTICHFRLQSQSQFSGQPLTVGLIYSALLSSVYGAVGLLAMFAYLVRGGLGHHTDLHITDFWCNVLITPAGNSGLIFSMSLVGLCFERAYYCRRTALEIRSEQQNSFFSTMYPAQKPTSKDKSLLIILLTVWFPSGLKAGSRVFGAWQRGCPATSDLKNESFSGGTNLGPRRTSSSKMLAVCMTINMDNRITLVSSVALILFSIVGMLMFLWSTRVCQNLLDSFAYRQAQLSLSTRVNLRFTILVGRMLHTTLIFGAVSRMLAYVFVFGFFYFFNNRRRQATTKNAAENDVPPHVYALVQHFLFQILHFPTMIFFSVDISRGIKRNNRIDVSASSRAVHRNHELNPIVTLATNVNLWLPPQQTCPVAATAAAAAVGALPDVVDQPPFSTTQVEIVDHYEQVDRRQFNTTKSQRHQLQPIARPLTTIHSSVSSSTTSNNLQDIHFDHLQSFWEKQSDLSRL